jgi:hypothetical protein
VAPEQINVRDDQPDDRGRQHSRVQREEPREGVMAVIGSSNDEPLQRGSDDRDDRREIRRDLRGPIPFLVPGQQVTGQRQRERELQQDEAEPEVHFARRSVGAVDDHLHQMQHEQNGHGVRSVVVKSAQEPSASHAFLNVINAFPRRV